MFFANLSCVFLTFMLRKFNGGWGVKKNFKAAGEWTLRANMFAINPAPCSGSRR